MRGPSRALLGLCAVVLLGAAGPPQPVSPDGMKAFEVSVAVDRKRAAMAWYGGQGDHELIYLQWLNAEGLATGAPLALTDSRHKAYEPDLRLVRGQPVAVWYEKDQAGHLTAHLARFDEAGRLIWRRMLNAEGDQGRNPVVREQGGVLNVAWIDTVSGQLPTVRTARYDLRGRRLGRPLTAGQVNVDTWNLNAVADRRGRFIIVYDAKIGGRAHELQMAVVQHGRARHVALTADDGHASLYPDLAIGPGGEAALTWFDERDGNQEVYLSVGTLDGMFTGVLAAPKRLTRTDAPSIGAYLAWNKDRLAVAWCDSQEGQEELYAQTFDGKGAPLAAATRLTTTPAESSIPSVRASGAGFLLGWNEYVLAGPPGHLNTASSQAMSLRLP